jgi:hypothetical protein
MIHNEPVEKVILRQITEAPSRTFLYLNVANKSGDYNFGFEKFNCVFATIKIGL